MSQYAIKNRVEKGAGNCRVFELVFPNHYLGHRSIWIAVTIDKHERKQNMYRFTIRGVLNKNFIGENIGIISRKGISNNDISEYFLNKHPSWGLSNVVEVTQKFL